MSHHATAARRWPVSAATLAATLLLVGCAGSAGNAADGGDTAVAEVGASSRDGGPGNTASGSAEPESAPGHGEGRDSGVLGIRVPADAEPGTAGAGHYISAMPDWDHRELVRWMADHLPPGEEVHGMTLTRSGPTPRGTSAWCYQDPDSAPGHFRMLLVDVNPGGGPRKLEQFLEIAHSPDDPRGCEEEEPIG